MNRLKAEVHDVLIDAVENGISNDGDFDFAVRTSAAVVKKITDFVDKNGDISLSCGSEWLYQSDEGQVNALALVGEILDSLSRFASNEDCE